MIRSNYSTGINRRLISFSTIIIISMLILTQVSSTLIETKPFDVTLSINKDGLQRDGIYVIRMDVNAPSSIRVVHATNSPHLDITAINIKNLNIDCEVFLNAHADKIFSQQTNYANWLMSNGKFTINVKYSTGTIHINLTNLNIEPKWLFYNGKIGNWEYSNGNLYTSVKIHSETLVEVHFNGRPAGLRYNGEYLYLSEGWNLVSNPNDEAIHVADIFLNNASIKMITVLNNGAYRTFNRNLLLGAGYYISPNEAFFVYSDGNSIIELTGNQPSINILSLKKGWNMYGVSFDCPIDDIMIRGVPMVTGQLNNTFVSCIEGGFGTRFNLKPGFGYYIYSERDQIIVLEDS